jgi:hypothetical protein
MALGPTLVGGMSDVLSGYAGGHSLRTSLVFVECLAVGVILSLLAAGRYIAREDQA